MELFFPSFCLGCQKENVFLCQDCRSVLEISEYNYCLCNKNPLRLSQSKIGKCQRCKDKKLSGLYFALPYKEKFLTKKLVHQFKYPPHIKSLSKILAEIILEHLVLAKNNTDDIWQNSILVPIPAENKKVKSRGYNQTELLVKELGQILNVSLVLGNLIKIKETLPQTKLSAKERKENLKNAFLIKNPTEFSGKKVFLVDDVYTTGSTMEECARILKEAKAKSVWGIAVAREE
ncbi:MAG: ComF family protein [Patescibacteria group bacterium]